MTDPCYDAYPVPEWDGRESEPFPTWDGVTPAEPSQAGNLIIALLIAGAVWYGACVRLARFLIGSARQAFGIVSGAAALFLASLPLFHVLPHATGAPIRVLLPTYLRTTVHALAPPVRPITAGRMTT
jgi:hypothetical protein